MSVATLAEATERARNMINTVRADRREYAEARRVGNTRKLGEFNRAAVLDIAAQAGLSAERALMVANRMDAAREAIRKADATILAMLNAEEAALLALVRAAAVGEGK